MKVTAFAPATVANVAVGFDILGFSFSVTGDEVTLEKIPDRKIILDSIMNFKGENFNLPLNVEENTATAGILKMMSDHNLDFGFKVKIKKGIPMGSGIGGSAASAVAGVVAANAFLKQSLSAQELLAYALIGESIASGASHADNVAPCLYGGLTLLGENDHVTSIPIPEGLACVILLPNLKIETKQARAILQKEILHSSYVKQSKNLAGFIAGCFKSDWALLKKSVSDVIVEPQRAQLVPGFYDIQKAAVDAGALGSSFSGSGPAMFALVQGLDMAKQVELEMQKAASRNNLLFQSWSALLSQERCSVVVGRH